MALENFIFILTAQFCFHFVPYRTQKKCDQYGYNNIFEIFYNKSCKSNRIFYLIFSII